MLPYTHIKTTIKTRVVPTFYNISYIYLSLSIHFKNSHTGVTLKRFEGQPQAAAGAVDLEVD